MNPFVLEDDDGVYGLFMPDELDVPTHAPDCDLDEDCTCEAGE